MTARGWGLVVASVVLVAVGWRAGWPELTALGAAGATLVVTLLVWVGRRARADLVVDQDTLRVVRGHPATVRVTVAAARPRPWLRLVEGHVSAPSASLEIAKASLGSPFAVRFPIDTSVRGQRPMGPFTLVQSDPWGVIQHVISRAKGGTVTVQPRVFPIRRSLVTQRVAGDSDDASRRLGDVHFHALRDYVLGDEPRMVHWRSSARAGHLVVRQNLAPVSSGTTVVLDTDVTAYGSDHQFGESWQPDRFERAVEVAASVVASLPQGAGQVHFVTTAGGSAVASATSGATNGLLDTLAVVGPTPPLELAPEQLVTLVRSTSCARLIVVTGTPSRNLLLAVGSATRTVTSSLLLRVGSHEPLPTTTLRVLDVESAEELV